MNVRKIDPIKLTKETAYLAGFVVGDGHISDAKKSKVDQSQDYRISIEILEKYLIQHIYKIICSIINTKSLPVLKINKATQSITYVLQIRNKSLYHFLTNDLEIPNGAKSFVVFIPPVIMRGSKLIKRYFMAGLFDTDGGIRGKGIGFTTASMRLQADVLIILNEFEITHFKEQWINKKYNRTYYGIQIRGTGIGKFLNTFPVVNTHRLAKFNHLFCGDAGAAKRDRGLKKSVQA